MGYEDCTYDCCWRCLRFVIDEHITYVSQFMSIFSVEILLMALIQLLPPHSFAINRVFISMFLYSCSILQVTSVITCIYWFPASTFFVNIQSSWRTIKTYLCHFIFSNTDIYPAELNQNIISFCCYSIYLFYSISIAQVFQSCSVIYSNWNCTENISRWYSPVTNWTDVLWPVSG